jgi:tRNA U38,U39,U40 pseudouridine synthase TruA
MTQREIEALFDRRDRRLAGFTAPAHGLILVKVRY